MKQGEGGRGHIIRNRRRDAAGPDGLAGQDRSTESKEVNVYFFSFMMALVSIGGTVLMILIIMRGINRAQEARQQIYLRTLEKGVYDYRLIKGAPSKGLGALGWGIFFAAVGLALFVSFIPMGILRQGLPGALIPFFIGVGLIIYYGIRKKVVTNIEQNGAPITLETDEHGRHGVTVVGEKSE
jgi:hypothetical protein